MVPYMNIEQDMLWYNIVLIILPPVITPFGLISSGQIRAGKKYDFQFPPPSSSHLWGGGGRPHATPGGGGMCRIEYYSLLYLLDMGKYSFL